MLLVIDTSTAACTAALFDGSRACVARMDEVIARALVRKPVPIEWEEDKSIPPKADAGDLQRSI